MITKQLKKIKETKMDILRNSYPQEMIEKNTDSVNRNDMTLELKQKLQYHQFQIKKIEGIMELLERNQDFVKMIDLFREIH